MTGGVIVDAEVGYTFAERYQLSVGAQNIFDSVPETAPEETAGQGNLRPESTPWDYNGAFWYTRLFAEF